MKHAVKPLQLELPPGRSWGGRRKGAGRKRNPKSGVPHRARPVHNAAHPVHATLRTRDDVHGLRAARVFELLVRSIKEASRTEFRIVQFSVQHDHIHLIVEACDKVSLSRGMRGLSIRLARAINRALVRRGSVWKERYHAHALKQPREVRNALLYVLMNHRKHGASPAWLDPRSSAAWFDGWRKDALFEHALRDLARLTDLAPPVQPARTWLAREGWRRHRLLGIDEGPGLPHPSSTPAPPGRTRTSRRLLHEGE
ncbi:transposase [Pendulispora rubella]|uniref:Transposase n=1 Tax=Pendulispora rubella TaxID=2741070 RepID=A0ABZ2LG60_9BACT